jgi:hypothetical protein
VAGVGDSDGVSELSELHRSSIEQTCLYEIARESGRNGLTDSIE